MGDIKPTPTGRLIVDIINKKMPGYIDGGMNFVDVEDVARGHILAAQKGKVGERYILGNENLPWKEYFRLVADIGGVEPPKFKMPYSLAIGLGYVYKFIANITGKPPLMTPSMARAGSGYFYYDVSKAVNELGFPQTPIRTTIEKAVNWFRENGYVKAA